MKQKAEKEAAKPKTKGEKRKSDDPPVQESSKKTCSNKTTLKTRMLDAGSEPKQMISPVSGVFDDASNPIIPLQKAVKNIPCASDLASMLWAAEHAATERLSKGNFKGLTTDGAAAIWLYTCESPLYGDLNAALRTEDRTRLKPYFPFLRLLLTALKSMSGTSKQLWRGVAGNLVKAAPGMYEVGKSFVWWGFSSTTIDMSVLMNPMFLGEKGARTLFSITAKSGRSVEKLSAIGTEKEILLPAGTFFKVENVLPQGSLTIIQVSEVKPPKGVNTIS